MHTISAARRNIPAVAADAAGRCSPMSRSGARRRDLSAGLGSMPEIGTM
jgi:hypothetical protein